MEDKAKFVINDLNKDYRYSISYTYTAEIISTKERFTITVESKDYDTLSYEKPCIKKFEENKKTEDKLRIKYEYADVDNLVKESYIELNGKQFKFRF